MIHGGLNINLKQFDGKLAYNQCCLSQSRLNTIQHDNSFWNDDFLTGIRKTNHSNEWLPECWQCQQLETIGIKSFRQSMIEKFGIKQELSGPQRIDFLFDRSCNLACRTCSPQSSSYWAKHLQENKVYTKIYDDSGNSEKIINLLMQLDLSNLEMIQFCGGETLLGNSYWEVAKTIESLIPDAKQRLEIGFQTNGTQSINPKWFDLIEKFKLVKLLISIDGTKDKFEYLRWPAQWNQTVENILHLRDVLPSNVIFFVQETTSCLNLYYFNEVKNWVKQNFSSNKEGDPTDYTAQLAMGTHLNVKDITEEYFDYLKSCNLHHVVGDNWVENPARIKTFIRETEKVDCWRNQDWKKTFPEVAEFYKRFL